MKSILKVFAFLAIVPVAILGIAFIFEIKDWSETQYLLLRIEGVILLLFLCSAAVSLVMNRSGKKDD